MKRLYLSVNSRFTCILLLPLFIISCDEPKPSDAAIQHSDSASVKKMDADSNSEMPMATPKDSPAEMPNPYKTDNTEEKPPPIK